MISYLKDVEASGDHLVWTKDYLKDRGGSVKRGIILTGGEGVSSFDLHETNVRLTPHVHVVDSQANANPTRHAAQRLGMHASDRTVPLSRRNAGSRNEAVLCR